MFYKRTGHLPNYLLKSRETFSLNVNKILIFFLNFEFILVFNQYFKLFMDLMTLTSFFVLTIIDFSILF